MIRKKKYEDNIQRLHKGTYKNRKNMIISNHQRILIDISACTPRYRIIPLTHKNNHSNLLRTHSKVVTKIPRHLQRLRYFHSKNTSLLFTVTVPF